jgi:hypothetical protein
MVETDDILLLLHLSLIQIVEMGLLMQENSVMKEVIVRMEDLVQIMRQFVLLNVDHVLPIIVILRVKRLVVVIYILIQMV